MRAKFAAVLAVAVGFGAAKSMAADMPAKAPPARVVAATWSGCYVGVVGGFHRLSSRQEYGGSVNGVPNAFAPTGFDLTGRYLSHGAEFGGTLGCNHQMGNWVVGIEVDGSYLSASGFGYTDPAAIALGANPSFLYSTDQRWMTTARARIGYASGRWLTYVTGGAAYGGFDVNNRNGSGAATAQRISTRVDQVGWIVGFGIEHAFLSPWSIKTEFLYADYGSMHYGDEPGIVNGCTAGCFNADVKTTALIWRVGLNYKFR